MAIVIWAIVAGLMLVWFYLCHKLFNLLKQSHPSVYETLGNPSLLSNSTLANNVSLIKFLFGRHWRELDDPSLSKLGQSMLWFFKLYLLGVSLMLIAFWLDYVA